jgi:hypothetical protein
MWSLSGCLFMVFNFGVFTYTVVTASIVAGILSDHTEVASTCTSKSASKGCKWRDKRRLLISMSGKKINTK